MADIVSDHRVRERASVEPSFTGERRRPGRPYGERRTTRRVDRRPRLLAAVVVARSPRAMAARRRDRRDRRRRHRRLRRPDEHVGLAHSGPRMRATPRSGCSTCVSAGRRERGRANGSLLDVTTELPRIADARSGSRPRTQVDTDTPATARSSFPGLLIGIDVARSPCRGSRTSPSGPGGRDSPADVRGGTSRSWTTTSPGLTTLRPTGTLRLPGDRTLEYVGNGLTPEFFLVVTPDRRDPCRRQLRRRGGAARNRASGPRGTRAW